jgi:hypothetical protein
MTCRRYTVNTFSGGLVTGSKVDGLTVELIEGHGVEIEGGQDGLLVSHAGVLDQTRRLFYSVKISPRIIKEVVLFCKKYS